MIGFAKVVGDVADGALSVVTFAIVTVGLTLLFVWIYIQSLRIALVPVISSLVAMVWMLGLLVILGYGVDPLGILVPFIIFAIGTSHGVQKISAVSDSAMKGCDCNDAARRTFRLLFLPAIVALLANLVGFITILLIPVQVIQELEPFALPFIELSGLPREEQLSETDRIVAAETGRPFDLSEGPRRWIHDMAAGCREHHPRRSEWSEQLRVV